MAASSSAQSIINMSVDGQEVLSDGSSVLVSKRNPGALTCLKDHFGASPAYLADVRQDTKRQGTRPMAIVDLSAAGWDSFQWPWYFLNFKLMENRFLGC
jgi:hypothetical protein